MLLNRPLRRIVHQCLLLPPVNFVGSRMMKLFPQSYAAKRRYVFPVKGEVDIDYGPWGQFTMVTEGADSIASRAYFSGALSYDRATACTLTALFKKVSCFYDIGANTGILSLMAAKHKNILEIHAFEPVKSVYAHLSKNIKANAFNKVFAHQVAVTNQIGKMKFNIPEGILLPVGGSVEGSSKGHKAKDVLVQEVPTITLDGFLENKNYRAPDLIKIDAETTEPEIIQGALKTIDKERPFFVVEVIRDRVGEKITELLKDKNYDFFHITDHGLIHRDVMDAKNVRYGMNYFLSPKEKSEMVKFIAQDLNTSH